MVLPNKIRGESSVTIDGKDYRTCFGVWGLAQLCAKLNIEEMAELEPHLKNPESLLTILFVILSEGGDWDGETEDSFKGVDLTFGEMTEAVTDAMFAGNVIKQSVGEEDDEADTPEGN